MATHLVKTRLQAARSIAQIGRLLQQLRNREDGLARRIAYHQSKLDAYKAEQGELARQTTDRITGKTVELVAFCQEHMGALTSNDGKTVRLDTGKVEFYSLRQGALQFVEDESAVVDEIYQRYPGRFDEFVQTTFSVRKKALKDAPDVLASLETAWAGQIDFVAVRPDNTEEVFRCRLKNLEPQPTATDAG